MGVATLKNQPARFISKVRISKYMRTKNKLRVITVSKLRHDARQAEHLVDRPWYKTPRIYRPRQYACLGIAAREIAREVGMAELVRRSRLTPDTILEILGL